MTPERFETLLSELKTTNGSDIDFLKKKFSEGYMELFSSEITSYNFSGLGWKFDIQVLFDTIFKDGSEYITKLDLCDNDLFGDISLFQKLPYLTWLNIEGCSELDGDISVFQSLPRLKDLNIRGCSKLKGDRDSLQSALPQCHL